jgi:hypothetical protein
MLTDPFGVQNVRANMHPGHQSSDVVGPSGTGGLHKLSRPCGADSRRGNRSQFSPTTRCTTTVRRCFRRITMASLPAKSAHCWALRRGLSASCPKGRAAT